MGICTDKYRWLSYGCFNFDHLDAYDENMLLHGTYSKLIIVISGKYI